MSFWNVLRIGASALNAQRLRLDMISNNIANAETTHTETGGPYQRRDVIFTPQETRQGFLGQLSSAVKNSAQQSLPEQFLPAFLQASQTSDVATTTNGGVKAAAILTDERPGPRVYDPTHPDADAEGFVTYPNVNLAVEMTNMLSATRSYEAGLTIVDTAKRMALKALEIGR